MIFNSSITFTDAQLQDLPEIVAIYNATIPSRMVTADTEPVSVESKLDWFHKHNASCRPLWIIKNNFNETIGWAGFQSFYGRPAYNATAEVSIYLSEIFKGKGYGKQILQYCLHTAPSLGIKTVLGFIFGHNVPSLKLFYGAGFTDWGVFPNIAELDHIERTLIIVGKRL